MIDADISRYGRAPAEFANAIAEIVQRNLGPRHVLFSQRHGVAQGVWNLLGDSGVAYISVPTYCDECHCRKPDVVHYPDAGNYCNECFATLDTLRDALTGAVDTIDRATRGSFGGVA